VLVERLHRQVDQARLDLGLVGLDVDDDRRPEGRGDLGNPARAVGVIRAGQDRFAAEALDGINDAAVVGGHDDPAYRSGRADLLVHVLDEGLARPVGQDLAREPDRGVPSGDDGDCFSHPRTGR
jgi:hypothetical protein